MDIEFSWSTQRTGDISYGLKVFTNTSVYHALVETVLEDEFIFAIYWNNSPHGKVLIWEK